MISPPWDAMPACHDLANAQLFDPPIGQTITASDRARYEQAAALCATCPVLERCATDQTVQASDGFRHGVLFTRDHGRQNKPTPRNLNPPRRERQPPRRPLTAVERTHKQCPRCHIDYTIDSYRRDRTRSDGRSAYCKPCLNRDELKRRAA